MDYSLSEAEQRYRLLLETSAATILLATLAGHILDCNETASVMYGYTRDEILALNLADLLSPEIVASLAGDASLPAGKPVAAVGKRKDGTIFSAEIHSRQGVSGSQQVMALFVEDFTNRKRLESKFLRAQRMESLGTLAAGIAHDLNNVLAPIVMALQYLRESVRHPDDQAMLSTLETSALRGASIVKQVLIFARGIDGDRVPLQPKHLLKEMAQIAQETFPKSIQVQVNYPTEPWTLLGDPTQLHQVMLNLCVNARDAMAQGGALALSLDNVLLDEAYAQMYPEAKAGPYVTLTVADTGCGIDPEHLDKIFDPFFTTKKIGHGSGLGLPTALGIVKSHEGFIQVKSQLGKGTQFTIYLPAIPGETSPVVELQSPKAALGCGELILVVDDEAGVQNIARQTLEKNGYRVLTANDGTEAIAQYAQHADQIRVVFTDMVMPFMDGVATIRALRKINPYIPIIASSGEIGHQSENETLNGSVQAFLPKPFTAEILLQTLQEVLKPK